MSAVDVIKDIVGPEINNETYRGIVVDNADPAVLSRVRIRVSELHVNVPDDALPWALPKAILSVGNTPGVGSLYVPVLGSLVYVEFLNKSLYYPVYTGYATQKDAITEELVGEDYPHCYGRIDRSGNKWFVNTAKDTVLMHHVSGTRFFIDGDGTITVQGAVDFKMEIQGDVNIVANSKVTLDAKARVDVRAGVIHLNSSGPDSASDVSPRTRPQEEDPSGKTEY